MALATERQRGRIAWLAVRSVPRSAALLAWFASLSLPLLAGLTISGVLGWVVVGVAAGPPLDGPAFAALVTAAAATALEGLAVALLAGSLLRPTPAAIVAMLATAALFASGLAVAEPPVLPAAGIGLLANAQALARAPLRRTAGDGHGPRSDRAPARGGRRRHLARRPVTAGERPSVDLHPAAAWAVLVTASLGVLIAGAELMVVAIALPSIVADFGGWNDLARASWIVNAYLVAFVVAMPLAGKAADLWGARRLYLVALLLFAAGSLGSGLAPMAGPEGGIAWLIGWRTVQGLGGGAMVPLSLAIAAHIFGGRTRAVALGVEGAATFVGMALGPAYGAWVLLNVSLPIPGLSIHPWQWIFLLNVPIAVVTLLAIYVVAGGIETPRHAGGLDLGGALIASVALVAGIGALSEAGSRGWTDPLVLGGLGVAALLVVSFLLLERRVRAPLIDLHLFASRPFSAANAVSLLTGYTLATAIIGGPVFVNRVLNGGPEQSAVALTALTAAIAAGAIVGGLASAVGGERPVTVLGVAMTALALWWALDWGTSTTLDRLVRDLAVFGAGFGLTVSPRATAAVAAAGSTAYGVASALLQITRTVGMSVGLALLTTIGQARIDELTTLVNDPARRDALVRSLGHPEFVGVDPRGSLLLTDLLERWSRTEAADVLRLVLAIALGVALATLIPAVLVGAGRRRTLVSASAPSPTVFRRPDPPPR